MELPTTQATVSGLSDLLVFPQSWMMYGLTAIMMAAGTTFWAFGHQFHRLFLMIVFLVAGVLAGWSAAGYYSLLGIHTLLAVIVGGLLGAGLGYWFFRVWLGILASGLIALVLLSLYSWKIAVPFLNAAADETKSKLVSHGLELAPAITSPAASLNEPVDESRPVGQAWGDLEAGFRNLFQADSEDDYKTRQSNFIASIDAVWKNLTIIIPRLAVDVLLTAGVALIFGLVLVTIKPLWLDIAYTSLIGLLLIIGGSALFLLFHDWQKFQWVKDNLALSIGLVVLFWVIGAGLQYRMVPAPPSADGGEEEDEEEEAPEKESSKGGKKKK